MKPLSAILRHHMTPYFLSSKWIVNTWRTGNELCKVLCCSVVLRTVQCIQQAHCKHLLTNFFSSVLIPPFCRSKAQNTFIYSFDKHLLSIYYMWNAGDLKMLKAQFLSSKSSGCQRVFSLHIVKHHICWEISLQKANDSQEQRRGPVHHF